MPMPFVAISPPRFPRLALALAPFLAFASFAGAQAQGGTQGSISITQPVGPNGTSISSSEPLVIHDPYTEAAHFVVRRLRLENQGPTIHVQPGTTVHATLEANVHCTHCTTPHNHLIVGYAGRQEAAACAWSGLRETGGWHTGHFTIVAPMQPGVYPIRIRIASSGIQQCGDATLSFWTRDLPGGPNADSTIGVLVVESPARLPGSTGTTTGATTTGATTGTTTAATTSATGSTTTTATATGTTGASAVTTGTAAITNGGFEMPDVAAGQTALQPALPGWVRMAGAGVEVHDNNAGRAAVGSQYIELDGTDSTAIATDIPTAANTNYLVSMQFAARPGTAAGDNKLEVRWNGELVGTVQASGEGATDARWMRVSFRVRATSAGSRLELRDAGLSNGQGTYVDDVAIVRAN